MKEDLSLLERLHHGLCEAVEIGNVICYGKKKGKKYCNKHYKRLKRNGSLNKLEKKIIRCRFIDCKNDHYVKGMCRSHYRKYLKTKVIKICKCEGCINKVYQRELCVTHYKRFIRYGDVNFVNKNRNIKNLSPAKKRDYNFKCRVKDCSHHEKAKIVKGLCDKHYRRWLKFGDYHISSKKEYIRTLNDPRYPKQMA